MDQHLTAHDFPFGIDVSSDSVYRLLRTQAIEKMHVPGTNCLGTYSTGCTVFSSRAFGPTSRCRSPRGPEGNNHHILNSVIGHKHQR